MQSTYTSDSGVRIVVVLFILINAVFLLTTNFLPFIDLPNHLAEATIYKYYDDPSTSIGKYYAPTPWYYPNTFHTVFCSLFPSVETGNIIFHILCIALLQISVFITIRELGGNLWYGLLSILFTYNYNVTFGFVGFAISIPMLVFLFYLTLLDIRKNKIILKVGISFTLVLLFLMHAQNALLGLLLYGLMMLYKFYKHPVKLIVHGIFIPLPLIIFILAWWFTRGTAEEGSTGAYLIDYYISDFWSTLTLRPRLIVFDNFQLFEGTLGVLVAAILFTLIFVPLAIHAKQHNREKKQITSSSTFAWIFFLTTLLCYLLLPDKLPGQTPLFQRFCTIVIISFIILASTWLHDLQWKHLKRFVLVCIAGYTALWFHYIYEFNQINKTFTKDLFTELDPRGRIAGLIYDNKYRGRKVYIHYPNYFLIWRKGIAASKIIDYRFGVVKRLVSQSQLPFYHELIGEGYREMKDYEVLEYLLVRGKPPVKDDKNTDGFELVKQKGPWKIYSKSN